MSSGQAIRAVQLFTKEGRSKQVNFLMELTIGLSLGIAAGATWKARPLPAWAWNLAC